MTQYRLKKETFGIPAGTIPMKMNEEWYTIECETLLYSIPAEAVENGSDFEKVEEPKKEGSMYSTAADCSRVTVSCEGRAKHEVYAEAWGDFIEEHALVDDEPEWENRFDALDYSKCSIPEYIDNLKGFIRSEFTNMGEEILELSNNQTNRAFCDDVMQVMRERGATK